MDRSNEDTAREIVARIDAVIRLCDLSCINSDTNRTVLAEAREALNDVASFFEVDPPAPKGKR